MRKVEDSAHPEKRPAEKVGKIGVRNVDFRVLQVDLFSQNLRMDESLKSTTMGGKRKSRLESWEMPRNVRAAQGPTERWSGDAERVRAGVWGGHASRASRAGSPETAARKGLRLGNYEAARQGVGMASCGLTEQIRHITSLPSYAPHVGGLELALQEYFHHRDRQRL